MWKARGSTPMPAEQHNAAGSETSARDTSRSRSRWLPDYALAAAPSSPALLLRKHLPIEPALSFRSRGTRARAVRGGHLGARDRPLAHSAGALALAYLGQTHRVRDLRCRQILVTEFSMARRRAGQGLREDESRQRQITETTPSVLWIMALASSGCSTRTRTSSASGAVRRRSTPRWPAAGRPASIRRTSSG
ncbi:MAG TPA: hypothetical protein VMK12_28395 [Anaeromyxobacteraceae bacterium]|nr:hypothetical protein [Anaeromyxobacteraceae bacterium]